MESKSIAMLKEKIKNVIRRRENKPLDEFAEVENRLYLYDYDKVSGYFFFDNDKKDFVHYKDVYVNKKAGLIVSIYSISEKDDKRQIKQISCIGQNKNLKPYISRCYENDMVKFVEFVDRIQTVPYNDKNLITGQWTTIGKSFSLVDQYDFALMKNTGKKSQQYLALQNNKLYNFIYKYKGAYNEVLDYIVEPSYRGSVVQTRTTYYVSNSKAIQYIVGKELSYHSRWKIKVLNDDIKTGLGVKEVYFDYDEGQKVEKIKLRTIKKGQKSKPEEDMQPIENA